MRRSKLIVLAPAAVMGMLLALSGPAGAGGKVGIDPGRRASARGLTTADAHLANVDLQNVRPLEQVSLNIVAAQDPDQPGTTPGGIESNHNETLVRDRS